MAVYFSTKSPNALLKKFNSAIRQTEAKGKITTWEISSDGNHYTHKAADWAKEAWFKATVSPDRLTFNIVPSEGAKVSGLAYAYYHGHLIETFLNHFDGEFTTGAATAMPDVNDSCD